MKKYMKQSRFGKNCKNPTFGMDWMISNPLEVLIVIPDWAPKDPFVCRRKGIIWGFPQMMVPPNHQSY